MDRLVRVHVLACLMTSDSSQCNLLGLWCAAHLPSLSLADHVQGTIALVDAAKKRGVSKFVLMSSLLTNGKAKGQVSSKYTSDIAVR